MKAKRKLAFISLVAVLLVTAFMPTKAAAFSVSSSGAILMEQKTGRVLYENNSHEIRRIASITKIMTAIIAIESGKMNDTVKVSKNAVYTEGSSVYLTPGESIKLQDLVYGLMLRSGNDAATAIAEHVGGSEEGFVFLMNQKAEELGMENTMFSNPHGLDDHEKHYSTPFDMAILTKYVMENETYQTISGTKVYKFEREEGPQQWKNKNRLLTEKYKYCTGGKTGFTKRAGRTLVTTASKDGLDLISVTLDGPDDWNDHISMYEYGFKNFQLKKIFNKGSLSIKLEGMENKELFFENNVYYPLTEKELADIKVEYQMLDQKKIRKKTKGEVGLAILYFQSEAVRKVPIFVKEKVHNEKSRWEKMKDFFFNHGSVM
ncbi:D-alanyl-D-alanine carboxypeptidase family protein [Lederbergia lenta]|uniref:serine-type D-Ala-D-Ala carboxypeptidase n=1 Tax=Lederbergia lenta TaxID=1467 RepID=A0A2X4VW32_LEDLE|nr:D-alanyl-D-alanine carboxypeptidase family protein [Lederbergia lenta]MEC2325038.1 D-alanyl-D-alanine carboxypeptidase [Lederbergia lenta]SQI56467.1 D-alanyl-D-alanine carboxypeptidase [Lederbergia lenta]